MSDQPTSLEDALNSKQVANSLFLIHAIVILIVVLCTFPSLLVLLSSFGLFIVPQIFNAVFLLGGKDHKLKMLNPLNKKLLNVYLGLIAAAFAGGMVYFILHIPIMDLTEFITIVELGVYAMVLACLGLQLGNIITFKRLVNQFEQSKLDEEDVQVSIQ